MSIGCQLDDADTEKDLLNKRAIFQLSCHPAAGLYLIGARIVLRDCSGRRHVLLSAGLGKLS